MRLSNTALLYELKNNLTLNGTLYHGDVATSFKYGYKTINKSKTTLVHGYTGAQNVTEIETVRLDGAAVGDKVQLADGTKGKVVGTTQELLEPKQLLFVPYDKAEKVVKITVQFI